MKAAVHTRYGPPDVVRITEVDKSTAKFPTRADHRGLDHGIACVVRKALLTLQGEILPREGSEVDVDVHEFDVG
jgi:hypothetical protein